MRIAQRAWKPKKRGGRINCFRCLGVIEEPPAVHWKSRVGKKLLERYMHPVCWDETSEIAQRGIEELSWSGPMLITSEGFLQHGGKSV